MFKLNLWIGTVLAMGCSILTNLFLEL